LRTTHEYFHDLGKYLDAGYYQNALFEWNGSGNQIGYGRSTSPDRFTNRPIEFVAEQRLAVLNMDHLGTGPVTPALEFPNFDDRITIENLQALLKWSIESGSTPYCAPVFFDRPYRLVPRFVRVYPDSPNLSNTSYPDWVIGSRSDDVIETGEGDDLVYGGPGNDTIDGGTGTNVAFYIGPQRNFTVTLRDGNVVVTDRTGAEGVDTLTNIQVLHFADGRVAVSDLLAAVGAR
jgi:Ca2+-binding RTX toxin-like protein